MDSTIFLVCCVIVFNSVSSGDIETDYYWKEYSGEVPSDALPAGKDLSGRNTYIGQAYYHSQGLIVGQIFPGQKEIDLALYGVKKVNKDIKILCTEHKGHFEWMSTTNKYFHLNTTDKHPVSGGYDFPNKGELHIGRLMYQGVSKIGKIGSYKLEDAIFHFAHNNREYKATVYQVLLYRSEPVFDISPRVKKHLD